VSEADRPVTIVTQTRVRAGGDADFARWQDEMGRVAAAQPGFRGQTVLPPSPPEQADWVILQRFASAADAKAWLNSADRVRRVDEIAPLLLGRDDVHLMPEGESGGAPAPVSIVISTRIRAGKEEAYRSWERRIGALQAKAPGFQGYRFEPPIPGVQEAWLSILRFDSDAHLQAWLASPERQRMLAEAEPLTEGFHARTVRTGFDQWFPGGKDGARPAAAWKMNMLVLLLLYPVVFLFGLAVQGPLLLGAAGLPFAAALFIGNVVSVVLLNYLVPWTSRGFEWWLRPARVPLLINVAGAAALVLLYGLMITVFLRLG
jgi:antibiotic biosynthesis monooxygenase (ABM) superfamily enzyme